MKHTELGRVGEEKGRKYLLENGYRILNTNFRTRFGEIDIVAALQDTIIFIEIKTRKSIQYGLPREAVNFHKQVQYSKLALYYLQKYNLLEEKARFDVLEIYAESTGFIINHIQDAFGFQGGRYFF